MNINFCLRPSIKNFENFKKNIKWNDFHNYEKCFADKKG